MCFEKSRSEHLSHHGSSPGIAGRILLGLMVSSAFSGITLAQSSAASSPAVAPVYKITPVLSKVDFGVKASVSIEGTFENGMPL